MFSLTVLNLDVLAALAWKRPQTDAVSSIDPAGLPEAPMAPAPNARHRPPYRMTSILPGWGL